MIHSSTPRYGRSESRRSSAPPQFGRTRTCASSPSAQALFAQVDHPNEPARACVGNSLRAAESENHFALGTYGRLSVPALDFVPTPQTNHTLAFLRDSIY